MLLMRGSVLKLSLSKYITLFLGMFFCLSAGAQMGDCLTEASWSGAPTETICSGDTIVLFNESTDADTWTWTVEDSQFFDADSVIIVTSALGGLSVELSVVNDEGCTGITSGQFLVQGIESVSINAQGLVELCDGSSTQVTVVGTYDQYLWSTGEELNTIFVNQTTEVYLAVTELETGCSATSDTVNVVVYPDPDPSLIVDGNTTMCPGDSVTLSTQEFEGYEWNSGQETQAIIVTSPGFFVVDVVNEFGCGSQSNLIQVQFLSVPMPELTYEGTTVFCGDSLLTATLLADSAWSTIEWSDGSTDHELDVMSSDNYWYCAEGVNGCWGCSDTVEFITLEPTSIEVFELLDVMEGECNGLIDLDVISAYEPLVYSWEFNGESIADSSSYLVDLCDGGEYSLTITDIAGCSVEWNTTLSVVTSVEELGKGLTLYPNPAVDYLSFDMDLSSSVYEIVSVDGTTMQKGRIGGRQISIFDLVPGVYYLKVEGLEGYRFVKSLQ
ncbi:MAG: hypothetical protein ACI9RU_001026 [Litorivivens sp.]|jgi:hypothetical protein